MLPPDVFGQGERTILAEVAAGGTTGKWLGLVETCQFGRRLSFSSGSTQLAIAPFGSEAATRHSFSLPYRRAADRLP